ncbi:universal stress protein [Pseudonocardia asaccharolytica]|uniref:UspA domain-containing protein n=1 Tax=Pseudonocardia asaccharolytica DSM 44247 = NBRC 16224 TaxID=1123024 RepID=A0A511D9A7_9PSEU|nr:universal stress protein [Pseudonocardia asaccharolytica]GEL20224.1 hypothetical protein PA7_40610 [Pseudonocardia asaccharolytica DSM 44247 = NBRC 16224]
MDLRDVPDNIQPHKLGAPGEPGPAADEAAGPGVVVGIDGSAEARAALHWAVRYARDVGATVHAVAVWHQPVQFADTAPLPAPEFEDAARTWLADALPRRPRARAGPVRTVIRG